MLLTCSCLVVVDVIKAIIKSAVPIIIITTIPSLREFTAIDIPPRILPVVVPVPPRILPVVPPVVAVKCPEGTLVLVVHCIFFLLLVATQVVACGLMRRQGDAS